MQLTLFGQIVNNHHPHSSSHNFVNTFTMKKMPIYVIHMLHAFVEECGQY
jgi:hypothetical protein